MNARFAAIAIFFVLGSMTTLAQKAKITGTVTDTKNEPMPFVNILVAGSTTGTSTDFDGKYKLELQPGQYKIAYGFIGYNSDTISVQLTAGQELVKNIKLAESVRQIDEAVVVTEKQTNTDISTMMEVKQSKQVVNAISAEMIKKTQDSDASEVVKRVPGVTIVGSNYIMIRGLNARYNNVLLHDVFAPSMEADIKSFAFDIIPSGMIDRIMIYKSPAADITGEFAGGVVKIYTKSIPDTNYMSLSLSTTFRPGSSLQDFKQPKRSGMHWLGFNDGYNDLPGHFPFDLRKVENDAERLTSVGRSLSNNWVPEQVNSLLDRSFAFSIGRRMKAGKVDIGNTSTITYSNSRTIYDVERSDYNAYDNINNQSVSIYDFSDKQYTQQIRTGLLHNWAFRFNNSHKLEVKNMFNAISMSQYVARGGTHYEFGYEADNQGFEQVYRGIYSGQLTGQHDWNQDRTRLTWTLGMGYSYRDQPDYRRYRSDVNPETGESTLFVGIPLSPNYLGRFFSEMRENAQTGTVALQQTVKMGKLEPILKTGVFYEMKDRTFNARNIGYVRADFANFDESLTELTIDQLFNPDNINATTGIRIGESTNPSDSYTATNNLMAGYGAVELPFSKKLNVSAGVRVENNVQQLRSRTLVGDPVVVDNPILSVLPSANVSYFIKEEVSLIRLAYGQTVNRPEFRELAPFGFYDFNFNLVKKGSDTLATPTIHNFDLRWERYPALGEMFSVGFFYKRFINPIETLFVPGGGSGGIKTFTYGNAAQAYSAGVEVEMRKSLSALSISPFMDRFSLMLNGAIIRSQVILGREQLGQSNERPLQGQSPYIANVGIFYKDDNSGLQANLLYNVIGQRIFIIGFDAYPDIYEMPRNVIDFNVSKTIGKGMELKFAWGDILNQEVLLLQDANANGKFERKDDQVIQRYRPGSTFTVGFGYKF